MNVQINNFQGIYGKMALSQTTRCKPSEAVLGKMTHMSENESASVKTKNAVSPYDVYASMRSTRAKFMEGTLTVQAKQPVQTIENERYLIEKSDELEGYWHIYDKRFDKSFVFDPNNTTVQTDETTGKNYLIAGAPTGGLMDAMSADSALMETLSQFLNVESADSISTSSLNEKYTITVDAFTGIECLKIKGNEGNGSWLMISDEQQEEKLQELANLYKEKYPNLIKSDGVAMGFAQAEAAGIAVRTENGILMITCNGMGYMDDANPSKSWDVQYPIENTNMYSEIMDAMSKGYIAGKDIEDFSKWEKYFEENGLEFEKVITDEELATGMSRYGIKMRKSYFLY